MSEIPVRCKLGATSLVGMCTVGFFSPSLGVLLTHMLIYTGLVGFVIYAVMTLWSYDVGSLRRLGAGIIVTSVSIAYLLEHALVLEGSHTYQTVINAAYILAILMTLLCLLGDYLTDRTIIIRTYDEEYEDDDDYWEMP